MNRSYDDKRTDSYDKRVAFELTRQAIGYRMLQLLQLPLKGLSSAEIQKALVAISQS